MTNDQKAILALTRENAALAARLAELDTRLTDAVAKHGEVARQFGESQARLAEVEELLTELNQRPRHFEGGVYWLRTYTGDYERIDALLSGGRA